MKEVLIAFVLALIIGATMNGLSMFSAPPAQQQPANPSTNGEPSQPTEQPDDTQSPVTGAVVGSGTNLVAETDQDKFGAQVLQSSKPVLVNFYADWCAPCKQMSPVIEKLAGQYDGRLNVVRVNIDKNPQLVAKYGIQSIPTFMIFKGGTSAETFAGSMPRQELAAAIDRQLN